MESYELRFRTINRYVTLLFIVVGICTGIYNIFNSTLYYVLLAFASLLFPFIPPMFFRVTKMRPVHSLAFLADIFCFFAFTVGMVFGGMLNIPGYDKFLHTFSGMLFGLVGLVIFYLLKHERKLEKADMSQAIVFSISFNTLVAVVWEIFEYIINFVLHNDPQKVAGTGVNDTMQDIIVCLLGALIFSVSMYRYYKNGKRLLLMSAFEAFFEKNMK